MPSYQYRKSYCGDKTILRPSYLHNGISYTGKMTSLYWIRALIFRHKPWHLRQVDWDFLDWCYVMQICNILHFKKRINIFLKFHEIIHVDIFYCVMSIPCYKSHSMEPINTTKNDRHFAFSWMKMLEFLSIFHWSLFLRIQLTIFQHWFR